MSNENGSFRTFVAICSKIVDILERCCVINLIIGFFNILNSCIKKERQLWEERSDDEEGQLEMSFYSSSLVSNSDVNGTYNLNNIENDDLFKNMDDESSEFEDPVGLIPNFAQYYCQYYILPYTILFATRNSNHFKPKTLPFVTSQIGMML